MGDWRCCAGASHFIAATKEGETSQFSKCQSFPQKFISRHLLSFLIYTFYVFGIYPLSLEPFKYNVTPFWHFFDPFLNWIWNVFYLVSFKSLPSQITLHYFLFPKTLQYLLSKGVHPLPYTQSVAYFSGLPDPKKLKGQIWP